MTALGASIGTGNIAGVATAIVSGGPGAVFWIWVYGFFATAIKFTRGRAGHPFREMRGGRVLGGAHALPARRAALAEARRGSTRWSRAWRRSPPRPSPSPTPWRVVLDSQFGIPTWASGIGIAVLAWLVIIGGVKSIGRAAEKLAPLKVGLYLAGGLFVIVFHAGADSRRCSRSIFREAFSMEAAGRRRGLGIMVAMRYGMARGIYANEAGYGTAAVAYGTARSDAPVQQGLNAVMEVFIVSFVTSTHQRAHHPR